MHGVETGITLNQLWHETKEETMLLDMTPEMLAMHPSFPLAFALALNLQLANDKAAFCGFAWTIRPIRRGFLPCCLDVVLGPVPGHGPVPQIAASFCMGISADMF